MNKSEGYLYFDLAAKKTVMLTTSKQLQTRSSDYYDVINTHFITCNTKETQRSIKGSCSFISWNSLRVCMKSYRNQMQQNGFRTRIEATCLFKSFQHDNEIFFIFLRAQNEREFLRHSRFFRKQLSIALSRTAFCGGLKFAERGDFPLRINDETPMNSAIHN